MLDAVAGDLALNVAPLVGHSVLRMYVMGDDARRAATADELAEMCDVLRDCLDAGAVGLSTSYVDVEDDLLPGAVPLRRARRARGAVRRARRARPDAADRPRVLRRRTSRSPASRCSATCRRRFGIPTTLSPLFHSAAAPTRPTR